MYLVRDSLPPVLDRPRRLIGLRLKVVVLLAAGQRGRTLDVDLVLPANPFWVNPDDPDASNERRALMGSYLLDTPVWEVEV